MEEHRHGIPHTRRKSAIPRGAGGDGRRLGGPGRDRAPDRQPGLPDGTQAIVADPAADRTAPRSGRTASVLRLPTTAASPGTWRRADPADRAGRAITSAAASNGSIRRPARSACCTTRAAANALNGPNDLVFDAHGGIYFTDLGKRRARDMDIGGVYYAKPDGSSIVEVAYPLVTPNGIGLSPDGDDALCRRDRGGAAVGVRHRGAGRREEAGPGRRRMAAGSSPGWAATSASTSWRWRPTGASASPRWSTAASRVISPGRPACRAPPDARPDDHQHLLRRPGHATAYITLSGTGRLVAVDWPTPGLRLNQAGYSDQVS